MPDKPLKRKVMVLKKRYKAGSQMWFTPDDRLDKKLRGFGCGVVALHDLVAYKGYIDVPVSRNEFKERIRRMEKGGIFVFPGLGIAPYYYPILCNLYLARHHMKLRMGWGHTAAYELKHNARDIKRCLKNDCPVIFAAGPTIPFLFRNKTVPLRALNKKETGRYTKAHYMTVLSLEEKDGDIWLDVATWSERLCISLKDLVKYSRYTMPFSTRFYRIHEIR